MSKDTVETYANDYYIQNVKHYSVFHDLIFSDNLNASKGTTYGNESQPFVVDWQMSETEEQVIFESPPIE